MGGILHCHITLALNFPLLETVRMGYSIFADGRLGSVVAKSRQCSTVPDYVWNPLHSGRSVAFSGAEYAVPKTPRDLLPRYLRNSGTCGPAIRRTENTRFSTALIDDCMATGGQRTDCIENLPPNVLAQLEAWESRNAAMCRRQLKAPGSRFDQ